MKRILIPILILCLALPVFGRTTRILDDKLGSFTGPVNGNAPDDNVFAALALIRSLLGGSLNSVGTGDVFYVDSGVSSSGDGTSWTTAKATLDEAVVLCADNNGDFIYVAQNHAENLAATNAVDLDVAGITVVGQGVGADMPEFTFTYAAGEIVIGAANVSIYNLRLIAATSSITMGISIEDAGDNAVIANCVFPKPTTNSWEFLDAIDVASGVTDIRVIGNEYYNDEGGAAPNHFIDLGNAVLDGVYIADNIIRGDFAVSAIWSNDADDEVYIIGNTISNLTSGQHCIEFTGAALGVCAYNNLYASALATSLDPGSLKCIQNYVTTAINTSAVLYPPFDDDLADRGTGQIFYVDSGTPGAGDGRSWGTAVATLDAAVALCSANNGDFIYVAQNHAESLAATNAVDLDIAGITVIGLGSGADMPEFTFTTTSGEFVIGKENITVYNLKFIAGTTSITMGISVEATGDDFTLDSCIFSEPAAATAEFLDAIDLASGADGFTCKNCIYYHTGGTGPAHFIEAGNGVNTNMRIINNEIQGQFSVAAIWSDTVDLRAYIADNTIRQMTAGEHCIEFTTTALGIIENNKMYADKEGSCLDPGSMYCANNQVSTALDQTAVLVPSTMGVKRYISKAQTAVESGTPNLFDVDGGPILITDFYGLVTTLLGTTATTVEIALDADTGWVDYDFSTAVHVSEQSAGDRIVFSAANESVLTALHGADGGATNLFKSWYCGEGMIEAMASSADNDGAITWYMEYIPLATGVTVTAQ